MKKILLFFSLINLGFGAPFIVKQVSKTPKEEVKLLEKKLNSKDIFDISKTINLRGETFPFLVSILACQDKSSLKLLNKNPSLFPIIPCAVGVFEKNNKTYIAVPNYKDFDGFLQKNDKDKLKKIYQNLYKALNIKEENKDKDFEIPIVKTALKNSGLDFDSLKTMLKGAFEDQNLNVVGSKALDDGYIFYICNAQKGKDILSAVQGFSAFAPCRTFLTKDLNLYYFNMENFTKSLTNNKEALKGAKELNDLLQKSIKEAAGN